MSIAFNCPHCDKQYRVKDELRGRTVSCKNCKNKIVVGVINAGENEFFDFVDDVVSEESAKPAKPRSRSQSQTSRGKTTAPEEKEKHTVRNMVLVTIHLILLFSWLSSRLWRAYHPEPPPRLPTAEQQKLIKDVKEAQRLLDNLERRGVLK